MAGMTCQKSWYVASDQKAVRAQNLSTYAPIPPLSHHVAGYKLFDLVAELNTH